MTTKNYPRYWYINKIQTRGLRCCTLSLILLLPLIYSLTSVAYADGPWYVSPDGDDSNDCLAVTTACQTITTAVNKIASGDTIIVAAGIYTENITLDDNLTLQGAGDTATIIDGNATSRVFTITAGSVVTITDITITNGIGTNGGGINNEGVLTLNNSTVISNSTYQGVDDHFYGGDSSPGGGIYNTGDLELNFSRVISNKTGDGGQGLDTHSSRGGFSGPGGGIYNSGTLRVNNSIINNNATGYGGNGYEAGGSSGGAGGIYNGGILDIHSSLVLSNSTGAGGLGSPPFGHDGSRGSGGGIFSAGYTGGEVITLSNSNVSYNDGGLGGGIYHYRSTLTIDNSSISENVSDNQGGGIGVSSLSVVTITNSTINDNVAAYRGGGIFETTNITSEVTIINSTVSGNSSQYGGGINVDNTSGSSTLTLHYSTVSSNTALVNGGGIHKSDAASTINLAATIIANNTAVSGPDCYGSVNSNDYNLIQDIIGCTVSGLTANNIVGQEPNLGPLEDNGGSTKTLGLLPGSPAIDAGGVDCPPPMTDQRGVVRPQQSKCDIGAFEANSSIFLPIILKN